MCYVHYHKNVVRARFQIQPQNTKQYINTELFNHDETFTKQGKWLITSKTDGEHSVGVSLDSWVQDKSESGGMQVRGQRHESKSAVF